MGREFALKNVYTYPAKQEHTLLTNKALFGDVETHTNNVLPQVETYVHRFGPGLVLYWFGRK